ncbi:MAG TPA: hypothetical protein VFE98_02360 [Candidatus Bathyarchaeia archaeon]|nr:hypothetical protein [Candidatus Bathyarchaeia archaeon]
MLDATILQFMVGIMAGTMTGIGIVRRRSSKKTKTWSGSVKTRSVSGAVKYRVIAKPSKIRTTRQRAPAKLRGRGIMAGRGLGPVTPTVSTLAVAISAPSFSACPACGLEAPETLMAEHFVQSPSHQAGIAPAPPALQNTTISPVALSEEERYREDTRLSFRNLLQMLVPPRAFGHRHQQKTVNPLSRLVHEIEVPSLRPRPAHST